MCFSVFDLRNLKTCRSCCKRIFIRNGRNRICLSCFCIEGNTICRYRCKFNKISVAVCYCCKRKVVILNNCFSAVIGVKRSFCQFVVCPSHINCEIAAGKQTFHVTCSPSFRNCRHKIDMTHVALNKHFRYSRCITEVSVDLERCMCIPQVSHDLVVYNHLRQYVISFIAFCKSCPCRNTLSHRPSCRYICSVLHRYFRCSQPLIVLSDQVSRV